MMNNSNNRLIIINKKKIFKILMNIMKVKLMK